MEQLYNFIRMFLLAIGTAGIIITVIFMLIFWVFRIKENLKKIAAGYFQLSVGMLLSGTILTSLYVKKIWSFSRNGRFLTFSKDEMSFFFWFCVFAYTLIAFLLIKQGWKKIRHNYVG